ncbi:acylneuraminate cytidylyltransferase [Geomonas azotofigens]|uniref:acylneuraminate cytidylyltransferase n=1 Tax=Geomonas azotofigens TaxID=2843196 RepID=UPI001C0F50D0|nr:acylneuraminate cytidylyltransferase [Geomonas azotofigens]MBU5612555.1 acylneuraminate cytidylyltransferase [Geomonas azotofigens]
MTDIVALVPLRGGSKSIPDKNIRMIGGKPLCAWVLEAACQSGIFSRVVVSTDSERIARTVAGLGLPVEVLHRPAEFATDTASTESVMLHAAGCIDFEVVVTIQATSPLVTPEDFRRADALFRGGGYDSLVTGVRTKRFFWNGDGTPLNYDPRSRPRRQEFAGSFMENGAFYFTRRKLLEESHCRLGGRVAVYEMAPDTAVEIDEPADWEMVERALRLKAVGTATGSLRGIRLLAVDVDGTLTDAGMYWSAEGDRLKKFNTRDAKGLQLVREAGVDVAVLTSENSPIVTARMAKLGITRCYTGVEDKQSCLLELVRDLNIDLGQVAYIGDDVNDLACLKLSGFSACPGDAVDAVRAVVHHVSRHAGGMGAVRELCQMILEARGC